MSLSLAFWIAMFIWVILGLWSSWPIQGAGLRSAGGTALLFILLLLLGWHVFGAPFHG